MRILVDLGTIDRDFRIVLPLAPREQSSIQEHVILQRGHQIQVLSM